MIRKKSIHPELNNLIFKGLKLIAWVIFIGLCIEVGGWIVNFVSSLVRPELSGKLYKKLDLSEMHERSKWAFYGIYSFVLVIAILKAHLFQIVVRLVTKIDLSKPFNRFVSKQISQISYYTLSIGVFSFVARQTVQQLQSRGYSIDILNQFWPDSQAFILMAAIVYVIAIIFSKGVEYQEELEETV
ncbi:MAG: DUF2975 domain-containing protein [Cytophagales bacterium]|nr:DUF2975 domain-containing protein [Cytophagales bacterium]